eukprot:c38803_g1_i1 orf=391-1428(-)
MAAPSFFFIESVAYPGYNLTQRGSHLVLAATNIDNPFQLWYKDDSWRFINDSSRNSSFALINHGSKKALKGKFEDLSKVFVEPYNPSHTDYKFLWSLGRQGLIKVVENGTQSVDFHLNLGVGNQTPDSADGIAAIVSNSRNLHSRTAQWSLKVYEPKRYNISVSWVDQVLTYKPPYQDVTYDSAQSPKNDELTVVGVRNTNRTGDLMVWLRIPAGGIENSNSSFIIINQGTGKALKGSTKPGDKVIATEYDPLDNDFVWSEDRNVTSSQRHVSVNLSSNPNLQWYMPSDNQYQNSAYYHPLTVNSIQSPSTLDTQRLWRFILVTSTSALKQDGEESPSKEDVKEA